jgi:hypothetical protein
MKRFSTFFAAALALFVTSIACDQPTQVAPSESTLSLTADPLRIEVFGESVITIIARKSDGTPVNEGTEILMTTTLGSVDRIVTVDDRGVAEARLVGDGTIGVATVEASSGAAEPVSVEVQIGALPATLFLSANPTTLSKDVQAEGATIKLSATVQDDLAVPIKSALVTFKSPRGVLDSGGAPIETGKRGIAKDKLELTAADLAGVTDGFFEVSASTVGGEGGLVEDFVEIEVSGFALNISLQPIPTSVPENGGQIELNAIVLDDTGEPLVDAIVIFSTQVGSISSGAQRTDFDGVARDLLVLTATDLDIPGSTFTVTAEVPGAGGTLISDTATITVQRGAPTAIISSVVTRVDTADPPTDTSLIFTSESLGDKPLTLTWDFGDGTAPVIDTQTGVTRTVVHDYGRTTGTFTVTLTVTNSIDPQGSTAQLTIDLGTIFPPTP